MYIKCLLIGVCDYIFTYFYLPSIVLQATSIDEKFKFKFFPTLKLHTSENSFSPIEKTLKTVDKNLKIEAQHL